MEDGHPDPHHPDPHHGPRFRAPRSSLAVGRRFRLLARSPLLGAGDVPIVPAGFRALGREPGRPPESAYEKQLVVPRLENRGVKDLLWAEARFAADVAAEHALFFSMLLPTETAPERKKEAQRLHERALKLFQRVEALGPDGLGDAAAFVEDVRSGLAPLLAFGETCARSQADGTLQSFAWPSLFRQARQGLAIVLDRMDGLAGGRPWPTPAEVAAAGLPALAGNALMVSHLIDPEDRADAQRARDVARRLALPGLAEPEAVEEAAEAAVAFQAEVARAVESARLASILTPTWADHLRREAAKFLDDVQRSRAWHPVED